MNRRRFVISAFACVTELSTPSPSRSQSRVIQPDLAQLAASNRLRSFNRTAGRLTDAARSGARLSEAPGDGVAYLEGIEFANGTIELDVRGKDVQQQSFPGVAFHGVDGATYDAGVARARVRPGSRSRAHVAPGSRVPRASAVVAP